MNGIKRWEQWWLEAVALAAWCKVIHLHYLGILTFNNLLNQTIKIYNNRNFPIVPVVLVLWLINDINWNDTRVQQWSLGNLVTLHICAPTRKKSCRRHWLEAKYPGGPQWLVREEPLHNVKIRGRCTSRLWKSRGKTVAFMMTVMETQVRQRILRPCKAHWLLHVHVSSAVWGTRRAYSRVYTSGWTSE